jgi:hypothetical protein
LLPLPHRHRLDLGLTGSQSLNPSLNFSQKQMKSSAVGTLIRRIDVQVAETILSDGENSNATDWRG